MQTLCIVLSLVLLLPAALALGIVALVRGLQKKPARLFGWPALGCLAAALLLFILGAADGNAVTGLTLGCLVCLAAVVPLVIPAIVRLCRRKRSAPLWWSAAAAFTAAVALFAGAIAASNARMNDAHAMDRLEVEITQSYDFVMADGGEPLEVVTSRGFDQSSMLSTGYRCVYDVCDLPLLLEGGTATAEQCRMAIAGNPNLGGYRAYFVDFVNRIEEKYPEADLTVLHHNLQTLTVTELDSMDYLMKSLSADSAGCYMRNENAIYIPKGTVYTEGEWGFQVLIHEFCHAARTVWEDDGTYKNRIQFCSDSGNTLLEECMNSVFSCSLLNYEERDIAYQVPSNYLRIMLECMDNYTPADYLNHSDLYFLRKLDEFNHDTNYAQVLWKLITLQRSDWSDDKVDIPAEDYYPIYEYLCDMYYPRRLTADSTPEERAAVAAELVDKAFFDAPEGYKTDEAFFYDYAETFKVTGGGLPDPVLPSKQEPAATEITAPAETTPAAVPAVTSIDFEHGFSGTEEYAVIRGLNDAGETVWTHESGHWPATELDQVQELGHTAVGYVYHDGGTFRCLNTQTGEEIWTCSGGGGSLTYCFDEAGTLYYLGYYGPDLTAIDKDGHLLYTDQCHVVDTQWPFSLHLFGDVLVWWVENPMEGTYVEVHADAATGQYLVSYEMDWTDPWGGDLDARLAELAAGRFEPQEDPGAELFRVLPETFEFSSGVGAWWTELQLAQDGTFTGTFQDYDHSFEDGYDRDVCYCDFTGAFTDAKQLNATVWQLTLKDLQQFNNEGGFTSEDEYGRYRYLPGNAYGLEKGKTFRVYLPGTPVNEVDDAVWGWMMSRPDGTTLPDDLFILYNVEEEYPFFGSR